MHYHEDENVYRAALFDRASLSINVLLKQLSAESVEDNKTLATMSEMQILAARQYVARQPNWQETINLPIYLNDFAKAVFKYISLSEYTPGLILNLPSGVSSALVNHLAAALKDRNVLLSITLNIKCIRDCNVESINKLLRARQATYGLMVNLINVDYKYVDAHKAAHRVNTTNAALACFTLQQGKNIKTPLLVSLPPEILKQIYTYLCPSFKGINDYVCNKSEIANKQQIFMRRVSNVKETLTFFAQERLMQADRVAATGNVLKP